MGFKETLNELQYTVAKKTQEELDIVFEDSLAKIVIIIELDKKDIYGTVMLRKGIHSRDDMCRAYSLFNKMNEDVNKFSDVIGYNVIN